LIFCQAIIDDQLQNTRWIIKVHNEGKITGVRRGFSSIYTKTTKYQNDFKPMAIHAANTSARVRGVRNVGPREQGESMYET